MDKRLDEIIRDMNHEFTELIMMCHVKLNSGVHHITDQTIKTSYRKRHPNGYFIDCIDELIADMFADSFDGFKWTDRISDKAHEIFNTEKAVQISERVKSEKKDAQTMPPIYEMKQAAEQEQKVKIIPQIIQNLIDAGQLKQEKEDGKYVAYNSIPKFCAWCMDNGYKDDITPEFIHENVKNDCILETIKRYCRPIKSSELSAEPRIFRPHQGIRLTWGIG